MFLIRLLRFLSGYVEFTVTGGFSERFINLCSVYDVPLWNVSHNKDYFTACTTINGYKKIPLFVKNSGVRVRKKACIGVPFIVSRLRLRAGLLAGVIFFFLCVSLLSNKVWIIDVSGNETLPDDIIVSAVKESGFKAGTKTKDVNAVDLSLDICKKVEGVSWAAVSVKGCCIYIDVKESAPSPETADRSGQYNLVASKDAQLVILEPYRGTPVAKISNPVLKGDILISGTVFKKDETPYFVCASGYAVGKTHSRLQESIPLSLKLINPIPIKKTCSISFFGINFSIGKPPDDFSGKFSFEKCLSFNQKNLPVSICITEFYNYENQNLADKKVCKSIALCDFLEKAHTFSKGKQITEADIRFPDNNEIQGNFVCYENIGALAELESDLVISQ